MRVDGSRDNSFDAVRLIAAVTVVVGHAWPLTGVAHPPRIAGVPVFTVAVFVFFSLSGYLIATSWNRAPRIGDFLKKRAARIFPGLIAVVVITVLIVGPLASNLGVRKYFGSAETWTYLTNVSLVASYKLPGVFVGLPRPVVNGTLWTLGPEFLCYLGIMVLSWAVGRARPGSRGQVVLIGILGFVAALLAIASVLPGAANAGLQPTLQAMVFFAVGAAIAQLRTPRLPLWPAAAGIFLWLVLGSANPVLGQVVAWIAVPYAVVSIGSRSMPFLRRAARFGDLSYGTYLWGFLVQQIVSELASGLPLVADVAIVVPATLLVAYASWRFVEHPALKLARAHTTATVRLSQRPAPDTTGVAVDADHGPPSATPTAAVGSSTDS